MAPWDLTASSSCIDLGWADDSPRQVSAGFGLVRELYDLELIFRGPIPFSSEQDIGYWLPHNSWARP
jgi:hypothetical protein